MTNGSKGKGRNGQSMERLPWDKRGVSATNMRMAHPPDGHPHFRGWDGWGSRERVFRTRGGVSPSKRSTWKPSALFFSRFNFRNLKRNSAQLEALKFKLHNLDGGVGLIGSHDCGCFAVKAIDEEASCEERRVRAVEY